MDQPFDEILRVLREILVPLVETDGGQVYVVADEPPKITVHLTGRHSGAPGIGLVSRRVVEPALRAISPEATVVLSSGWRLPAGAIRVERSPSTSK